MEKIQKKTAENSGRKRPFPAEKGRTERNDKKPSGRPEGRRAEKSASYDVPEKVLLPEEGASVLEGRNSILEALRAGRPVDKLFVQSGLQDGPVKMILAEAQKAGALVRFVEKQRLDQMSETGHHQGVIAYCAAFEYAEVDTMLDAAAARGEDPFLVLLDGIEDPHNLGAIIRSAHLAGAHGVIIPKNRAVGLTAAAVRASAGALAYTPVARVTNLTGTIRELKEKGLWFVCAAMDGEVMYRQKLTGPIGLVIGSEGDGVSRLVREACDFTVSIPMAGQIDSLNASVAAGILSFEILRQRKGL